MRDLLEEHPGRPHRPDRSRRSTSDTDRDFVMTAEEAKEYGIIDEVIIDPRRSPTRSGPITAVR